MTPSWLRVAAALLMLAASGCTPLSQYLITAPVPDLRLRPAVSSLVVRDVELPRYASTDEIVIRGEDGVLKAVPSSIWAESPERAMSQALARNLGVITGARTALEPWPFAEPPAAQLLVRVEDMVGGMSGRLQLTGFYAISPVAADTEDQAGRFDISVPLRGEGAAAVADAQGRAISELSERIARALAG